MAPEPRLHVFVVCAPGLEGLVAGELHHLGVRDATPRHGGVGATVTWPQLGLVHLHSRVATRVLVRMARFRAPGFHELERGLRAIDWSPWWPTGTPVLLRVASSGSALYHTGAIEERALPLLPAPPIDDTDLDDGGAASAQTVHVRVQHDEVTVSLDASGLPLHRRGWRTHIHDAPLRETLAAALVLTSGWDRKRPLVDPCCGAGTIPIEAAMLARRMPPGRHRAFAFQRWPRADGVRWDRLVASADADVLERNVIVVGGDRHAEPLDAARRNAERAGVGDLVRFEHVTASRLELPARQGWLATNPPYGERMATVEPALRDLADLLRRSPAWPATVLAPTAVARRVATLAGRSVAPGAVQTTNGGLRVDLAALPALPAVPVRPAP